MKQGADAGAEEEAVDCSPEQHAAAAADEVVNRGAEEVAGGVCDEEERGQFRNRTRGAEAKCKDHRHQDRAGQRIPHERDVCSSS